MPAEKIAKFQKLVELHPKNELARYSLASALYEDGHFAQAEVQFARALELKDDWVMAYVLRARCLLRLGRNDEARPLLAKGRAHSLAQHHQAPVDEIDALLAELP